VSFSRLFGNVHIFKPPSGGFFGERKQTRQEKAVQGTHNDLQKTEEMRLFVALDSGQKAWRNRKRKKMKNTRIFCYVGTNCFHFCLSFEDFPT
jgi:hypothetical protein